MGDIIRYQLEIPHHPNDMPNREFMVREFIPSLQRVLEENKWMKKVDERSEGGSFLVGYRGHLYTVGADFQVGESECEYSSVGCGYMLALGSLYSTKKKSPEKRIRTALEAACKHNVNVMPPFRILKIEGVMNG